MTIKELILYGTRKIKENNIENANLQAKLLLSSILNKPKEYLIINQEKEIKNKEEETYKKGIQKIIEGYPIQYIIKNQEFMKLNFYVDENVLIPQPDTEILVEEVINITKKNENLKILDMCTGSGAIAISLAKYIKNSKIYAIDISKKAIQIAKKNAKQNNVYEKIVFLESNMFEKIPKLKFDIIVSNPPYIERNIIENLSTQVKYEPLIALDGGIDGLDFYKIISDNAYKYLNQNGNLCLEIGYNQRKSVTEILLKSNKYKEIYCKKDLENNDRVIIAKY